MAVLPIRPPPNAIAPMSEAERAAFDRGERYGVVAGRTEATIITLAAVVALTGAFFVGAWLG